MNLRSSSNAILNSKTVKHFGVNFALFLFHFISYTAPQNPTSDFETIDKDMIWAQLLSCRSAGYVLCNFCAFSDGAMFYNILNSTRILIGCYPRSIRVQMNS